MKPLSQTAMAEATRLTTEGRLDEAMALLRGTISGASAVPPSEADFESQSAPPEVRQFIDMVPPSPATGGYWTSPLHAVPDSSSTPERARIFPGAPPENPTGRARKRSARGGAV